MGYDKLLGKGRIERPINITVSKASATAISKVEAAGGSVIINEE
jgi:ribosomal protein L15